MSGAVSAAAAGDLTIDEATHTIRYQRDFGAGPEQVFNAWTRPEELSLWWDPSGEPLQRCDIDLRPGGQFTFVGRDHPDMPFSGVYREIRSPERLVFEALGATGRVLLAPSADGTRMTVEIACANAEHLERFVAMGVHEGTSRTLDNLVAYIAGRSR